MLTQKPGKSGLPLVLLVDDEPSLRTALKRVLSDECDVETYEARDGLRAIELLKHITFDVAVVDLQLGPGPNGFGVLDYCRKVSPRTRRILYSSHAAAEHVDSGIADRVLHKLQDARYIASVICELAKNERKP